MLSTNTMQWFMERDFGEVGLDKDRDRDRDGDGDRDRDTRVAHVIPALPYPTLPYPTLPYPAG